MDANSAKLFLSVVTVAEIEGLIGVLVSSFNEHVIEVALEDIQGAKNAEFK